jgi:single-strand DNA-binding protein
MAASNINKVIVTGNLTQEPNLRETGGGTKVCELRVACNSAIKKDGAWESKPNYFQVNAWGGMGENCDKYLSKGSKVAIDGRLEWQMWEKKDGEGTNSRVVIVANQVEFLGGGQGKKDLSEDSSGNDDSGDDKSDDDIPF